MSEAEQDNNHKSAEENSEQNFTIDDAVMMRVLGRVAIVSETDASGNIIYVNDKFVEISKYGEEELIGQNSRILKSDIHSPSLYEDMWREISAGFAWRGEIKNKAKDGSYYWVDSSIVPIFDKDDKIVKYIAIQFPITDKKEIEEKNELFSKIINETSQVWGMADLAGKMLDANLAFVDLLGYNTEELLKMNYADLLDEKYHETVKRGIESIMGTADASFSMESELVKKDKSKIYAKLTINSYKEDGLLKYIYAFITDMSERRLVEESIKNRVKELEEMNRIMINRELKMIELKEEIRELKKK